MRLAQDFALRYPLVDGQGNFGNIDGDSAAAMRYTESRMTDVATRLMEGITENAVDFKPTYDGEDEEPVVLPSNFPNLLANGSTGIAVGMATSIPPHNVAELCDAALHLIHAIPTATAGRPACTSCPARISPPAASWSSRATASLNAYETGRGSFRAARPLARARTPAAASTRSSSPKFPTACRSRKLVEKIAELLLAKKLPLLKDVRDESADDIRLVLEPRAGTVDAGHPDGAAVQDSPISKRASRSTSTCSTRARCPR